MSGRGKEEFKHRTAIFVSTTKPSSPVVARPLVVGRSVLPGDCSWICRSRHSHHSDYLLCILQEGAFRAWSHLGGLDPEILETMTVQQLDPLVFVLENDRRLADDEAATSSEAAPKAGGIIQSKYAYEPLPRSGIAHPFVRAILTQFLGPTADEEALEFGVDMLRTWWQHRRKGENKTSIKTMHTDEMLQILDKYMRYFFELAHCLVVIDKVEAPRTLKQKMEDCEKRRKKEAKKGNGNEPPPRHMHSHLTRAQHGVSFSLPPPRNSVIHLQGKCVPGFIDLPRVVVEINRKAALLSRIVSRRGDKFTHRTAIFVSALVQQSVLEIPRRPLLLFGRAHHSHSFCLLCLFVIGGGLPRMVSPRWP